MKPLGLNRDHTYSNIVDSGVTESQESKTENIFM